MNATPTSHSTRDREGKAGFKSASGRDRLQEASPPMVPGYCDCCGVKIEGPTHTRRGDLVKFCGDVCRRAYHQRARSAGVHLYRLLAVARMFKHADPERANEARSEIAEFFVEHFEAVDALRECLTEADGRERLDTKTIRKMAKGEN